MLGPALLEEALQTLGAVLRQRGLSFEAVTIGGSSLMLLGLINRPTRDLDLAALVSHGEYNTLRLIRFPLVWPKPPPTWRMRSVCLQTG